MHNRRPQHTATPSPESFSQATDMLKNVRPPTVQEAPRHTSAIFTEDPTDEERLWPIEQAGGNTGQPRVGLLEMLRPWKEYFLAIGVLGYFILK
jgi:hypothetical protein